VSKSKWLVAAMYITRMGRIERQQRSLINLIFI
jgi:hypothetical protein